MGGEIQGPVAGAPAADPGEEHEEEKLDEKDKNRKPPDGPIDYKNSQIAGKDVSNRILASPPDGDFIWVQLMDGSFRFASRPILTRDGPGGAQSLSASHALQGRTRPPRARESAKTARPSP